MASTAGPDLVGFHKDETGYRFAFGEVKTSSDTSSPPRVISSDDGLNQQLLSLHNRTSIGMLIAYLKVRVERNDCEPMFKEAAKQYARNNASFYICGFIIRDVNPNKKDLESTVKMLCNLHPSDTKFELTALYVPQGRIQSLPEMVLQVLSGEKTCHYRRNPSKISKRIGSLAKSEARTWKKFLV